MSVIDGWLGYVVSSIVELMMLVAQGRRSLLHADARKMVQRLLCRSGGTAVTKVQRITWPQVLRALMHGSAQRLMPLTAHLPQEQSLVS